MISLTWSYPYTINPGGPNHEELVSIIGIYEYLENVYNHHFDDKFTPKKISRINQLISKHEEDLGNPILEYISNRTDLKLIGKNKIKNKNRAPTISFVSKNKTSKSISEQLVKNGIATRNDNFYAWRCLNHLGIDTNDGVVRISIVHYNNNEDINNLLNSMDKI